MILRYTIHKQGGGNDSHHALTGQAAIEYCLLTAGGKWVIAFRQNGEKLAGEQLANAKLVAAAPELLAALELALPCLNELKYVAASHGKWVSEGLAEDAFEATINAIKKAKGE